MNNLKNVNDLIRIGDSIAVLCRKTCHQGPFCPDAYCDEMWDKFDGVERIAPTRNQLATDCISRQATLWINNTCNQVANSFHRIRDNMPSIGEMYNAYEAAERRTNEQLHSTMRNS